MFIILSKLGKAIKEFNKILTELDRIIRRQNNKTNTIVLIYLKVVIAFSGDRVDSLH